MEVQVVDPPRGGFDFELCARNEMLASSGTKLPRATSTGTTIVGLVCDGGVVLGADTRATNGSIVADKNCRKIHYIAPNIYCCGAGTAADTDKTTDMISSRLELHRLRTGRESRVQTSCRMLKQYLYQYQGHVSAALVLGGVDCTGPKLYSIHPHGSTDKLPYVTMGSGSLAAMAVFEARYKPGLSIADAKELVADAILAGVFNDLGSGSNVDVCVITKDNVDYIRPYNIANVRPDRHLQYRYPKGSVEVISETVTYFKKGPQEAAAEEGTADAPVPMES